MSYWTEFPNIPRVPHDTDVRRARRLNLIAALIVVLLGLGLAASPRAAAPYGPETASYGN